MPTRRTALIALSAILVAIALWLHLGPDEGDYSPPALTAEELAMLQPGLDTDVRLLAGLRRQAGAGAGAWRELPEALHPLYLTLWAEEIHRIQTWSQFAALGPDAESKPTLVEVADAYATLGQSATATAVRTLARRVDQHRPALQAWTERRKAGREGAGPAPRDAVQAITDAAGAAFSRLDACRAKRLEYARVHSASLGLR